MCSYRIWRKLIIQGRGDMNHWVTVFHIEYTTDGINWVRYNHGATFKGNTDRNTQVHYDLVPFKAIAVKIVVESFHDSIALRLGLFYEKDC